MLLLPGTVLDAAVTFAERVRKRIEAHTFTFPGGTLRRTASFGVSGWPHPRDQGLRLAGARGRRRAVRREGDGTQPRRPLRRARVQRAPSPGRMEQTHALRRRTDAQPPQSTEPLSPADELARLQARLAAVERERDHLAAIVDILQEVSSSLHFVDVLQTIARKLGETFGLDRCSIFLSGEQERGAPRRELRGSDDPEPDRRPESLPGAQARVRERRDGVHPRRRQRPGARSIKATLDMRNVRSIVVVPIRWEGSVIGAIFLRTEREAEPFSDADVRFCQTVASLTAKSLRNAHRFETLLREPEGRRRRAAQGRAPARRARRLPPPPARPLREGRGAELGRDAPAAAPRTRSSSGS